MDKRLLGRSSKIYTVEEIIESNKKVICAKSDIFKEKAFKLGSIYEVDKSKKVSSVIEEYREIDNNNNIYIVEKILCEL